MAISATDSGARVDSPCLRLCVLEDDDICAGCFRSLEEICAWSQASSEKRAEILRNAAARREQKGKRA